METSIPSPSPPMPPAPPAPPVPAPAPAPPMPPGPVMEGGGPVPAKPASNFFEGITLLDVGMVALVSLALYCSIYASRLTIQFIKSRQQQMAAPPVSAPATAGPAAS